MRQQRAKSDKEDVLAAHKQVGGAVLFREIYTVHIKGKRAKLMAKDIDIARRYRERHGLPTHWWHLLEQADKDEDDIFQ